MSVVNNSVVEKFIESYGHLETVPEGDIKLKMDGNAEFSMNSYKFRASLEEMVDINWQSSADEIRTNIEKMHKNLTAVKIALGICYLHNIGIQKKPNTYIVQAAQVLFENRETPMVTYLLGCALQKEYQLEKEDDSAPLTDRVISLYKEASIYGGAPGIVLIKLIDLIRDDEEEIAKYYQIAAKKGYDLAIWMLRNNYSP